MDVGEIIRLKRKELKESQGRFGKRFGISHAAVSDLERGVTTHIPSKLFELLFYSKTRVQCSSCDGKGYVEVEPKIKAL